MKILIKIIATVMVVAHSFQVFSSGDATISGNMSSHSVSISTCDEYAGAVCGLVFNGTQLVDNWDHGRQIQTAVFYSNSEGYGGEAFAPTEAGSRADHQANYSTSVLNFLNSNNNIISKSSNSAFWLAPGECSPAGLGACALNETLVSETVIEHRISIGYVKGGIRIPHVIEFETDITLENSLPPGVSFGSGTNENIVFEAFSGHFAPFLNRMYVYEPSTKELVEYPIGSPHHHENAIVLSNNSQTLFVALYTPDEDLNGSLFGARGYRHNYALHYLTNANSSFSGQRGMGKLSSTFRKAGIPNETHSFKSYLALAASKNGIEIVLGNLYQYVSH